MSNHTPGPWEIEFSRHGKEIIVSNDNDGWHRLFCQVSKDDCDTATALANACLIAATPEMLAALQMVLDDPGLTQAANRVIRSAINKATKPKRQLRKAGDS